MYGHAQKKPPTHPHAVYFPGCCRRLLCLLAAAQCCRPASRPAHLKWLQGCRTHSVHGPSRYIKCARVQRRHSPLLGDNHAPSALRALVPWCPPRRKLVCAGFGSARPQHPLGALVVTCRLDEPTERQTVLPHTYSTAAAFLCLPIAGLHPVPRVSASSVYSLRSPSSCHNLSARAI